MVEIWFSKKGSLYLNLDGFTFTIQYKNNKDSTIIWALPKHLTVESEG